MIFLLKAARMRRHSIAWGCDAHSLSAGYQLWIAAHAKAVALIIVTNNEQEKSFNECQV
jgi:predicted nucleic acid-binding protein